MNWGIPTESAASRPRPSRIVALRSFDWFRIGVVAVRETCVAISKATVSSAPRITSAVTGSRLEDGVAARGAAADMTGLQSDDPSSMVAPSAPCPASPDLVGPLDRQGGLLVACRHGHPAGRAPWDLRLRPRALATLLPRPAGLPRALKPRGRRRACGPPAWA